MFEYVLASIPYGYMPWHIYGHTLTVEHPAIRICDCQADVSVAKGFSLGERAALQFRADIFNLFNNVNLDNPQTCVDCLDGGTILNTAFGGAALQRQIMFSLKFQF